MFFLQAMKSPVIAQIGDNLVASIPKLTIADVISWGSAIMSQRVTENTKDMTPEQRREYLSFYPPLPPNLNDMKMMVRSPEGVRHVLCACLPLAKITMKSPNGESEAPPMTIGQVNDLIKVNGVGALAAVAWACADLDESAGYRPPPKKEGTTDPLPTSENPG